MAIEERVLGDQSLSEELLRVIEGAVAEGEPIRGILATLAGNAAVATDQRLLFATEESVNLKLNYEDLTAMEIRTGWWSRGISFLTSEGDVECDVSDRDAVVAMADIIRERAPHIDLPESDGESGGHHSFGSEYCFEVRVMQLDYISELASAYPPSNRKALIEVVEHYGRRHEREVLELAAIAADVGIDDLTNLGLEPDEHPLLQEAFERQFPGMSVESLAGSSPEYLQGIVNGVKGKYFEILIRDRLESGGSVGGVVLGDGETVQLAESATQPGFDLRILDRAGEQVEALQAKATTRIGYVKDHLDKYPGIKVIVPEERGQFASETPGVLSAEGLSNEEMTEAAKSQVQEWGESGLVDAIHHGAEYAIDAVPVVSIGVTMIVEGQRVLTGRSTVNEALKRGGRRVAEASVWTAAGAALTHVGVGEPVSAAAMVGARMYAGRVRKYRSLADTLDGSTEELRRLI